MQAGAEPEPCWVELLDDRLLGQIFVLAGVNERQCQAVCRRWRRVWYSQPGLWRTLRLSPITRAELQLAILPRVAPLVERLAVLGTESVYTALQQQGAAQWSLPAVLACFPAGQRQRLQAVRVSTDLLRMLQSPAWSWALARTQPLPAAALRQLGRLRGLRALELDSWQLPHCTAHVLSRLTQLSRLRLRARELPPGCLPGVVTAQMTQLHSFMLETSVACSPVGIAQLTALSALTRLEVRQANPLYSTLVLPQLDRLPHLAAVRFENARGTVQLPGGHHLEHFQLRRRGDLAGLSLLRYDVDTEHTLASLLDSLVPQGVTLDRLQACRVTYDSPELLAGCSHLRTLRSLDIYGLYAAGEGEGSQAAAVRTLLEQATQLTELSLGCCLSEDDGSWDVLTNTLHGNMMLRKLLLSYNALHTAREGPFLLRVEHLDLSCCQLQEFPDGVVFGAPLLRTLSLAGNTDVVLKPSDMRMLELPKRLQSLDLRGMIIHPTEAILLARKLPNVQLILDSAEQQWDPDHGGPGLVMRDLSGEDWGPAADAR